MAALPFAGHASAGAWGMVVVVVGTVVVVVVVPGNVVVVVVVVLVEVVVVVVVGELAAGLDTTSRLVNSPQATTASNESRPNLSRTVAFTSLIYRLPAFA
jgi:hypothetical protein